MFFLKIWNFNQLLPMFIKTEDWPTLTQFNLNLISTLIACFFFAAFANIYSHSNFHLGRLTRNSFIKTDPKLCFQSGLNSQLYSMSTISGSAIFLSLDAFSLCSLCFSEDAAFFLPRPRLRFFLHPHPSSFP